MKIIQIATGVKGEIYGLDSEGNLYYWGWKDIAKEKDEDHLNNFYGWILMKDELNAILQ